MKQYDVVVVGAGPAGCSTALAAARAGASVLILEKRRAIGIPVQCAEYVPHQLRHHVPWSSDWVAQRTRRLRTTLPDGTSVETPAPGYVIHRDKFDQGLASAAGQAGAEIMLQSQALRRTDRGLTVRSGQNTLEVGARVIVGADGPRSTVRPWIGEDHQRVLLAVQARVRLSSPVDETRVTFDPFYRGGYGWLFPKGDLANVGVGVTSDGGPKPDQALRHLMARLEIPSSAVVSRTRGVIPCGGPPQRAYRGNVLLVGDAAGQTHPITGAGVAHACLCGQMAGRAAAEAAASGDLEALAAYERNWHDYLGGVLNHAVRKRRVLEQQWDQNPAALSALLRETWVAFPGYGRRP